MASIVSVTAGCAGCLCVWLCSVFPALSPRLAAAGVDMCVFMFFPPPFFVLSLQAPAPQEGGAKAEVLGLTVFQPPPSAHLTPHHHHLSLLITAA